MIALIAIWLFAISILDVRSRRVPVWLLAFGGVIVALTARQCGNVKECFDLLKGMGPGVLLLAAAFVTRKVGYGDGIVLLLLGMMSEGKGAMLFGTSLFLISVFSILLLALRKAKRDTRIPYLPFLAVAWLITVHM